MLTFGLHLLGSTSQTQAVISLSSGEAEFYAMVRCATRLLGALGIFIDSGMKPRLRLHADASAGIGVASRRGAGSIRHIETQCPWLQRHISNRVIELKKVHGKLNVADIGTKILTGGELTELLRRCNLVFGLSTRSSKSRKAAVDLLHYPK